MNSKVFYRISSESRSKPKLPGATKLRCLANFLGAFGTGGVTVIADNCDDELLKAVYKYPVAILETTLGNSRSFMYALSQVRFCPDNMLVYLVEDDYLHRPGSLRLLQEGLQKADYVTLYDHPDKYGPIYEYQEETRLFRTDSSHWKWTASTCMTFAALAKTLREDIDVWQEFCDGPIPKDHEGFCELRVGHGRTLASCVPGHSCHTDLTYSMVEGKNLIEPWAVDLMIKDIEQSIYKSWDADAIELMEEIMHHQDHPPLELLVLISEIEAFNQKKRSGQLCVRPLLEVTNPTELTE